MHARLAAIALSLFAIGCPPIKQEVSKAAFIDYDQTNNFVSYEFLQSVPWNPSENNHQNGIEGVTQDVTGFWLTFVLCHLSNNASNAGPFTLDLTKFSVVYDNETFFYKDLEPNTYQSIPSHLPASNQPAFFPVNTQFKKETQIGNNQQTFSAGFDGAISARFAIHVHKKIPYPQIDPTVRLSLRLDGAANVLLPANQDPAGPSGTPATKSTLATTCRPAVR